MNKTCVCNSGKQFILCCEPLLNYKKVAKTPVQLMRSRFSAFALGGHGKYLLETWAVQQRTGMTEAELSVCSTEWLRLEVIDKLQKGDSGLVEFKAYYRDVEGGEGLHHERSDFERVNGRWFYVSGQVF